MNVIINRLTMEKAYITKNQINKAHNFVEHICVKYRLENYFGAISVSFENLLALLDNQVFVSFSHCKGGVCFSFESESCDFRKINFDSENLDDYLSVFLIKSLSDEVNVSAKGDKLEMCFYVDGVEKEIAIGRREKIEAYSHRNSMVSKGK